MSVLAGFFLLLGLGQRVVHELLVLLAALNRSVHHRAILDVGVEENLIVAQRPDILAVHHPVRRIVFGRRLAVFEILRQAVGRQHRFLSASLSPAKIS